jgi:hypothetical protein
MEIKTVIKVAAIFSLFLGCHFMKAQDEKQIYIKFEPSKIIVLDENYCVKNTIKNKIVFAFGLESLGEINQFIFKKDVFQMQEISLKEYQSLEFSTIKELNQSLIKERKFNKPNEVFSHINIVEKFEEKIFVYKVCWKKILFEE